MKKHFIIYHFLLVITELFSLGVTAEVLRGNIDWKSAFLHQQGQFHFQHVC